MDEKFATELAYKNGYEQGVKDFAERLKEKSWQGMWEILAHVDVDDIVTTSEELLKGRAKG